MSVDWERSARREFLSQTAVAGVGLATLEMSGQMAQGSSSDLAARDQDPKEDLTRTIEQLFRLEKEDRHPELDALAIRSADLLAEIFETEEGLKPCRWPESI